MEAEFEIEQDGEVYKCSYITYANFLMVHTPWGQAPVQLRDLDPLILARRLAGELYLRR